jgi:sporulation protein YlmC with PRC-barrel domain/DNA-directed RNA polymerase subunit RPC12/RpoP
MKFSIVYMMSEEDALREKKLRGSGGFVYAKVTDDEQKKGNLGGPELFLAGIGRLPEKRLSKYFCNKCEKEYRGSPLLKYENPNEDLGEGVILAEKGEYRCATCNNTIAQYRKFDPSSISSHGVASQASTVTSNSDAEKIVAGSEGGQIRKQSTEGDNVKSQDSLARQSTSSEPPNGNTASVNPPGKAVSPESQVDATFHPIQSLIGMPAYDSEALLIGRVQEIGLRRPKMRSGNTQISIKIIRADRDRDEKSDNSPDSSETSNPATVEIQWNEISKIGDIVLINRGSENSQANNTAASTSTRLGSEKCSSCGHQNEKDASFCEECGNKL